MFELVRESDSLGAFYDHLTLSKLQMNYRQ